MDSTLMTSQEKHYKHGGVMEMQDKALRTGGYKSTWLVDLAAAYVLENTQNTSNHEKIWDIQKQWNMWYTQNNK